MQRYIEQIGGLQAHSRDEHRVISRPLFKHQNARMPLQAGDPLIDTATANVSLEQLDHLQDGIISGLVVALQSSSFTALPTSRLRLSHVTAEQVGTD